ncbi:MAG: MerR family DNA-binding protein, partial [Pseudomonadota bacterium]
EKDGRSRSYGPKEIARLTLILRGRRFGFSLEEIRQWLLIYEEKGSTAQMEEWIRLADRQLEALGAERDTLDKTISDLESLRNDVARSKGADE